MPNNVSVKISADVVDLQAKFAVAKAESAALNSELNKLGKASVVSQALSQVGFSSVDMKGKLLQAAEVTAGAQSRLKTLSEAAKDLGDGEGGKGLTSATKQFKALAYEVANGNWAAMPGTLAAIATRTLGLGGSALVAAGGIGALAASVAYFAYQAIQEKKENDKLAAGFELTGRSSEMAAAGIKVQLDFLASIPGVTRAAAESFLGYVAAHASIDPVIANETGQLLPKFIQQLGEQGPAAAGHLAETLSNLTEDGFKKLDHELLNLEPREYQMITNLIQTGQTAQAVSAIMAALSAQSGVYIKSLGDQAYDILTRINEIKKRASEGFQPDLRTRDELKDLEDRLKHVRDLAREGQQQASNNRFKGDLDDANKLNASLQERSGILRQIATFEKAHDTALQSGDRDAATKFSMAIINEKEKLTKFDQQENAKVYRNFVDREDAKASVAKQGSAARIQAAEAEVSKAKELFGDESNEYYQAVAKMNAAKLTGGQQAAAAQKAAAREAAQVAISTAREEISAINAAEGLGAQERLNQAKAVWAKLLEGDKLNAVDRLQVQREINNLIAQANRQASQDKAQIERSDASTAIQLAQISYQQRQEELQQEVEAGRMTAHERIAILIDYLRSVERLELAAIDVEERGQDRATAAYAENENKKRVISARTAAEITQLNRQMASSAQSQWRQMLGPIEGSLTGLLGNARGILGQLVATFAEARLKIEFDWLAGQAAMALGAQEWAGKSLLAWLATELGITAASETTAATKAAGDATAATAGIAFSKAAALGEIPAYTGIASMEAASSVAAIPIVGPALAAAAFAEMQALGATALGLASLDTGTNMVPDDMISLIHAGERVIPAADNRELMGAVRGSNGKGDVHYHNKINMHFGGDVSPDHIMRSPQKRRIFERYVQNAMANAVRV